MTKLAMFDLTGKAAIVTGGCSGLGLVFAEALAEAGANVALPDVIANTPKGAEAVAKVKSYGVKAFTMQCDVSKEPDVQACVDATVKEFGHVDILVNNAGISGESKRITDMSPENWDRVLSIDLRGAFLFSRAVGKIMTAQKSGKIINIASASSFKAVSGLGAYATAKAGMVMLTKTMAVELGRSNVQVNAMSPGYLLTELNRAFFESEDGKKVVAGYSGMKRLGTAEELKGTIVYLASNASSFTTGANMIIDGGQWL